jgi:outer membrane protein TolC
MNTIKKFLLMIFIPGILVPAPSTGQTVLRLEDALSIAAQSSPDIKRVKLNLERSQQLLTAQLAAQKSNFSLNFNPLSFSNERTFDEYTNEWYSRNSLRSSGTFTVSQPIVWTDGRISLNNQLSWQNSYSEVSDKELSTFTNNLYLNYSQPLFTYNQTKMALEELELDMENSQISFDMQLLSLERMVAQSFYSVYQAQMSLQISQEEYTNQQASYEIIKNKVEGGLVSLEELYQAEVSLASSKSSVQNAEVSLLNAKDQLKITLGMDITEEIMVLSGISVESVPIDLDEAIKLGLENRLELRQRQIDIQNAEFSLIRTKAINEFAGNLSVQVGLFGDNERFPRIYESPNDNEQLGLTLQIPIFDWGERKARIKAAEVSIETQKLTLSDERIDIVSNIREVHRSLQNLLSQISIAEQNVRNSQLTYDINLEKYRNGDLTGMDLNLYQNQLSQTKMDLSNAQISYKLELLNMKIQTLYDWETRRSIVPEKYKK